MVELFERMNAKFGIRDFLFQHFLLILNHWYFNGFCILSVWSFCSL